MRNLIYKLHVLLYGYPCRSQIRDCLDFRLSFYRQKYDVGILYVCGVSIKEISAWLNMPEKNILRILNELVDEKNR